MTTGAKQAEPQPINPTASTASVRTAKVAKTSRSGLARLRCCVVLRNARQEGEAGKTQIQALPTCNLVLAAETGIPTRGSPLYTEWEGMPTRSGLLETAA